jgi:general secretion pathway protein J
MGGLTLIELMVALTIFAILGVLSYRAVSAATDRQGQLAREFQRWRDIARFLHMTESDILQVVVRPPAQTKPAQPSIMVVPKTDNTQSGLDLLTLDGTSGAVRRRGYWLDGGCVMLTRWSGVELAPVRDIVLEDVMALRISAVGPDGQKSNTWPPNGAATTTGLPAAIEIELELPDAGTIRRLFALR